MTGTIAGLAIVLLKLVTITQLRRRGA